MISSISELYRHRCTENGDLNEHLPMLFYLSLISNGVAEFGVARGISTCALIAGQDSQDHQGESAYYGYDPNPDSAVEVARLKQSCKRKWPSTFTQLRSVDVSSIPNVDLLFIDSLHTEETVAKELNMHLGSVRRFVALHDTTTFGEVGELPNTRGLIYGMGMLMQFDSWLKVYDSPRNNGLTVFQRRTTI